MTDGAVAYVMGNTDLLRCLAPFARCVVVAPRGASVRYSRWASDVVDWDPDADDEAQLEAVERLLCSAGGYDRPPVLFYETDASLSFVSRHRERLGSGFRFVVDTPAHVEDCLDKARFADLARRRNLPVPTSRHVDPTTEPMEVLADLSYPTIVKPMTHGVAGWDGVGHRAKVLLVESAGELRELWPRLAGLPGGVLVQEMVPGPETRIESYHVYVDHTGEIAGEFTGRKIRTLPAVHGYSTALEITDERDVRDLGRATIRALDLRGVAKLDVKRDAEGRLWLLEVNPRCTLWNHPGMVAGVNLPGLVLADLAGLERPTVGPVRAGVHWVHPLDLRAAWLWGVSPVAWARWWWRTEAKSVTDVADPVLVGYFGWQLAQGVGRRLQQRLGRLLRPRRGTGPADGSQRLRPRAPMTARRAARAVARAARARGRSRETER